MAAERLAKAKKIPKPIMSAILKSKDLKEESKDQTRNKNTHRV